MPPRSKSFGFVRGNELSSAPQVELSSVLIVDDDLDMCRLLTRKLDRGGYRVTACHSSEEAFRMLRRSLFDLVLCDIELPGLDGLGFCSRIRDSHPDLPVVMVTGHGGVELARTAMRTGATDFVTKPIELDALTILVEKNLERKRVERGRELSRDSRLILQFIEALAAAIDAKESATAQHSLRVMEISQAIARALGLPESQMLSLELAALVHGCWEDRDTGPDSAEARQTGRSGMGADSHPPGCGLSNRGTGLGAYVCCRCDSAPP